MNFAFVTALSLILAASSAQAGGRDSGGAGLLSVSGEHVQAILGTGEIWRNYFGPMKSLRLVGDLQSVSNYDFEVFDVEDIRDARGVTTGYRHLLCSLKLVVSAGQPADPASSGSGEWLVAVQGAPSCVETTK